MQYRWFTFVFASLNVLFLLAVLGAGGVLLFDIKNENLMIYFGLGSAVGAVWTIMSMWLLNKL